MISFTALYFERYDVRDMKSFYVEDQAFILNTNTHEDKYRHCEIMPVSMSTLTYLATLISR